MEMARDSIDSKVKVRDIKVEGHENRPEGAMKELCGARCG